MNPAYKNAGEFSCLACFFTARSIQQHEQCSTLDEAGFCIWDWEGRVFNDAIRTLKTHQGKYDTRVRNLRKLPKQWYLRHIILKTRVNTIKHEISKKSFSASFSSNATWTLGIKMPPFSYSTQHFGKPCVRHNKWYYYSFSHSIKSSARSPFPQAEVQTTNSGGQSGALHLFNRFNLLPHPRSRQLARPKTSASLIGGCLKLPLSVTILLPSGRLL